MQCEKYTIRMTLAESEVSMLLTAINGYKHVVSPSSKRILDGIENLIGYQIKKQDKEFEQKYLEQREKMQKNA